MNVFVEALGWLAEPAHWSGPTSIPVRVIQHLALTLGVTFIACAIAIPLGAWMGHRHRGEATIVLAANATRALPTLGLVTLVALGLGIGLGAPIVALVVLAVPSVLAAAYSGVANVTPDAVDAGRALGYTPLQTLTRVEVPLALPVIGGGVQSALLQVVATATIAAYVSDAGLGRFVFAGLRSLDYAEMLAGSLLIIGLALVLTGLATAVGAFYRRATTTERKTT